MSHTWTCPVCKNQTNSNTLICSRCGFDESKNYWKYDSVALLPASVLAKEEKTYAMQMETSLIAEAKKQSKNPFERAKEREGGSNKHIDRSNTENKVIENKSIKNKSIEDNISDETSKENNAINETQTNKIRQMNVTGEDTLMDIQSKKTPYLSEKTVPCVGVLLAGLVGIAVLILYTRDFHENVADTSSRAEEVLGTDINTSIATNSTEDTEITSTETAEEVWNLEDTWTEGGNLYFGTKVDGIIDGKGICEYADGSLFIGEFSNGLRSGTGIYLTETFVYDGEWKEDQMSGWGSYYLRKENGAFLYYRGQWKENQEDGSGSYYRGNGEKIYVGRVNANELYGSAVWVDSYYKGIRYCEEGEYAGTIYWPDGAWYQGSFRIEDNGLNNGEMYYPDGLIVFLKDGEIESMSEETSDIIVYSNGDQYRGELNEEAPDGQGTYYYADGAWYQGSWKDGRKEGFGQQEETDGWYLEGDWHEDTLDVGNGCFKYEDYLIDLDEFVPYNLVPNLDEWRERHETKTESELESQAETEEETEPETKAESQSEAEVQAQEGISDEAVLNNLDSGQSSATTQPAAEINSSNNSDVLESTPVAAAPVVPDNSSSDTIPDEFADLHQEFLNQIGISNNENSYVQSNVSWGDHPPQGYAYASIERNEKSWRVDIYYDDSNTWTDAAGNTYLGAFVNGVLNGNGICRYSNGDRYIGEWSNGMKHGIGVYIYAAGGYSAGTWVNDSFISEEF